MAVTITATELAAALRVGDSLEETAEVARLLAYATEAVTKHVENAPDAVHNEAVRRIAGYLFDMPEAGRGDGYANAMRNSGAARILLPYRLHRAGYTDAVAVAQEAVGTVGNPVTGIDVTGTTLTVTFADGSTESHTLPAGGGGGTLDQTARDSATNAQNAASAAQGEIDAHEASEHDTDSTARSAAATAQTEIDAHEASTHNTDNVVRSTALNARQVGEQAQTAVETHRTSTHNTDTVARSAASTAEAGIASHLANHPSGIDQTARDSAAAAQADADTAQTTAGQAQATATGAQTDIDDHEANHPVGGSGITAAQAARLLPTHTAAESGRIALSTGVADQWALGARRVGNPVLATRGNVLGIVCGPTGVNIIDDIPLPSIREDGIPHVGSLPSATSTSPDVLFLTHTHTRGVRQDATLTVGFAEGNLAGYSTERPAYGSINKLSPLIRIYGVGDISDYSLQDHVSFSDDWLGEFSHTVINGTEYAFSDLTPEHGRFFRRVPNYPSSLTAASVTLNYKRADGTYYFNNAAAGSDQAGLYVKRDDGVGGFVYNHLITFGDVHGSGIGPPVRNPRQGGATYINEGGHLYTAAGSTFDVTVDPSGTESNLVHAKYDPAPHNLNRLYTDKGNGGFWWNWAVATPGFGQFAGPNLVDYIPNRTWFEIWTHILAIAGGDNPTNIALQAATFLGRFNGLTEALEALQFRIEAGETFAASTYYYGNIGDQRVKRIDTFAAGTSSISNNFHWVGRFATENYVDEKVAEVTPGGGPTILYESATATIDNATGLIPGNIVCPETGMIQCYFEQSAGDRKGSIATATIPAARIRAAVSALAVAYNNDNANVRIIALGANRGVSIGVQATTNYLMLNAQSAGTFTVRIAHEA